MNRKILLLFMFGSLAACTQTGSDRYSAPLTEGTPGSVGVSDERLARIDMMCLQAVADGDVPGMVALVARHGKIVYHKAFGMANSQAGRALKKDDIFRIASQSKAITATAVMMLWEEGRFSLDDPISEYITEFSDEQVLSTFNPKDTSYTSVPSDKPITIRNLLTHTSGIGYGMIDGDDRFRMIYQKAGITDLYTTENLSIGENIKKLAVLPLHHNPGEGYTYSEGLDVLGYFIEIISGMPFDEFLRTRLFDPLGMNDTWFYLPEELHDRLVPVQYLENGEWMAYPVTFYDPDYPVSGARTFFSGGAGLCSTAKDYATFLQMYLNGGELNGVRILSRTTVKTIMSNHFTNVWDGGTEYNGLAFGVLTEKGQAVGGIGSTGTFHWGGYFNTQYFADPQEQLIGVFMKQTQNAGNDETGWRFRQLVGQVIND